jgi:hypothetical protein
MHDRPSKTADGEVSLGLVRQRLKLLGELAKPVSSSLGVQPPA